MDLRGSISTFLPSNGAIAQGWMTRTRTLDKKSSFITSEWTRSYSRNRGNHHLYHSTPSNKSRLIVADGDSVSQQAVTRRRKSIPKQEVSTKRLVSRSSDGRLITSVRQYQESSDTVLVTIESKSLCTDEEVDVLWGVYRASPDAWQFPKAVMAVNTTMDDDVGAMSTPMKRNKDGKFVTTFEIPHKLSPLTFAYALRSSSGQMHVPRTGGHFTLQIGIEQGHAGIMGSYIYKESGTSMVNFAVECRGADYVNLVLVLENTDGGFKIQEFALDASLNRTGTIWHASITLPANLVGYGWRVNGDLGWEDGYRISPDSVLIDPEAHRVVFVEPCSELAAFPHIKTRNGITQVALSSVSSVNMTDMQNHKSKNMKHGYGMLSLDPGNFGTDNDIVEHPGTFLGVAEASQYFASLGINSIVLRKPYTLDATANRTVTFFAPDPLLASSGNAEKEFQDMVKSLHQVGIEVLVSIDLTLTAEGSDDDPCTFSWRGFDNPNYYRSNGVLNCGNPVAQEHLIRALRHWAVTFRVDGFEFLYAENMTQNMDEVVMDAPALPDALCHDPILSGATLIASPHTIELLPRKGERGFPHWGRWRESCVDKMLICDYFVTPPPSRDPSTLQNVAAHASGRPHLFSPSYHGFPGNLSAQRPIPYSINDLDISGWVDSVVSKGASAARAVMLADGQQEFIPSAASLTRAIIASTIFSSGTPSFPIECVSQDTEDFIRNCLTCRPILANILDSGSVGTWLAPSGHPISLDAVSVDNFFLGRLISSHEGTIYTVMNPETRPVTMELPSVKGPWRHVVDSYSGDVVPAGKTVQGFTHVVPAKSFSLFISQS